MNAPRAAWTWSSASLIKSELYAAGGLQFLPFNTLYQLAVDKADGLLDADDARC